MSIEHKEFCIVERENHLLVVTLNRPQVMNALNLPAHRELSEVFNMYLEDPELRVAIITGAGERGFCTGTDLKWLSQNGSYTYPRGGFAGITKRYDLWKPVIAAVNGIAVGGGMEIVAACDLAVASESAQFGLPEPLVGLAALGGGVLQRLARQIPMKNAMYLALTAKRINAMEAMRAGIVNDVVPQSDLMHRARELAADILACAPLAIQATKQAMLMSLDEASLEKSSSVVYPGEAVMMESQDALEGPLAFAEKRKPVWQGR